MARKEPHATRSLVADPEISVCNLRHTVNRTTYPQRVLPKPKLGMSV